MECWEIQVRTLAEMIFFRNKIFYSFSKKGELMLLKILQRSASCFYCFKFNAVWIGWRLFGSKNRCDWHRPVNFIFNFVSPIWLTKIRYNSYSTEHFSNIGEALKMLLKYSMLSGNYSLFFFFQSCMSNVARITSRDDLKLGILKSALRVAWYTFNSCPVTLRKKRPRSSVRESRTWT